MGVGNGGGARERVHRDALHVHAADAGVRGEGEGAAHEAAGGHVGGAGDSQSGASDPASLQLNLHNVANVLFHRFVA